MILSFSDAEEGVLEQLKNIIVGENNVEKVEIIPKTVLFFKDLEIHLKEREVYHNGKPITLSNPEFLTLKLLTKHPGWVYTKEQIYKAIFNDSETVNIDNSVYCIISGLRKKLEIDSAHPEYIQTVRGVGYKFTVPEK